MTKRDEQREQRRIRILESALDLFVRKGYGETKIADIAQAADMSMGLLFRYFESKEKLYEALIQIGSDKLKVDYLSSQGDSPLAIFKITVESFFNMIKVSPFAAKMFVLMENAQHLDILSPELKEMLLEADRLIENSASLIVEGQELGEIKEGNPEALAVAFWCSIQGIAQRIALYPETPCPKTEWIISILEA